MFSCAHSVFPAVAASWLWHLFAFLPFAVSSVVLVWHYVLPPAAAAAAASRSARSARPKAEDKFTAFFGEVDVDDTFGEFVDIYDILCWERDVDNIFVDEKALLSYVPPEDIFDELVKDESQRCEQKLKQLRKDYDWDDGWFRWPVSKAKCKRMMRN